MNRRQRTVVWVETVVLLLMFAFPPYFGIDRESEGRVHAPLGYFPFWNPPSSADVLEALAEFYPAVRGGETRLESFQPGLNKVSLTINATLSLIAAGVCLYLLRKKSTA